ncbi:caspase family protein [Bradyrhizobium sp. 2TAF24]|uniref:caspase family protein n=1 Tax=Bradyrhizobium sp. 2TAF24 TaxID=3233011 RepID=UPI003F92DDEF
MRRPLSIWIGAACVAALLLGSVGRAEADRRIALIVGNAHYGNPALTLSNPKNDAEDVADALRAVGFEVLKATDASKRDMDLAMARFARAATDSDAALFFYAGHALQYQGRNYLIPTDAEVEDEVSLRYQLMPIDDVRAALDRATGVKVMILDACRNNPIVESIRRRTTGESRALGGQRGLARIDKTQGMVIAYSTAADEVAADGSGRNSPFTRAFLKRLKEPGLEIEQLFRRVAADVNTETGGRQRPETYVSLLSDYYLNQTDRTAYDVVKESSDPAVLRDFVSKYPSSSYVPDARYRIQHLELQAQEKQLQQIRQEEAARRQEDQRRADQEAALRKADEQRRLDDQRRAEEQRKQDEQQRARQAEAERTRAEREATLRQQDEQRQKAAAEAQRPPQKVAGIERLDQKDTKAETPPPPTATTASCDQDAARLARLRANPALADIVQFERELTCDRLRPQVARLRESLAPPGSGILTPVAPPQPMALDNPPPLASPPPPAPAKPPERLADLKSQPSAPAAEQTEACKQAEARLARLRANPSYPDVVAFERELGCDRLRLQVARLRESLALAGSVPDAPLANAATDVTQDRQATVTPPTVSSSPEAQKQACEQDRAALARLRSAPSRDGVLRFERELRCEALRPQVARLRESLAEH